MKDHGHRIFKTFTEQARRIAAEMHRASSTGLGILEETLTDITVNRIQFRHEDKFLMRKFTRKEEGTITGADWLWCIGEPGSWVTFAIQAKVVNPRTGRVNYLHYKQGQQYRLLVGFSRRFGLIPKYSVFGTISKGTAFFARSLQSLGSISADQWSFSMVSPRYIKGLVKPRDKDFSRVLDFAVPWSYVFSGSTKWIDNLIAKQIAANLEKVYWELENEYRRREKQTPRQSFTRTMWENPQPSKLVTERIPMPVLYLLSKDRFPHPVPISRVSVLSAIPAKEALQIELMEVSDSKRWKLFPHTFANAVAEIQERASALLLPER
jgi:hypothetical protein